jgi:hypothetical protein
MLYAITVEPLNAVMFLSDQPRGDHWEIQEGVELDIPANLFLWSDSEAPPRAILGRSLHNDRLYKVFVNKKDIDRSAFLPLDLQFGGVFSRSAWERFLEHLPSALALQAIPDDDPSGAMDEAIRNLRGAD